MYMPVLICNEENAVINHSHKLAEMGNNALIVTGKCSSRKNGSLYDVETALNKYKIKYKIFDDVEENPSVQTIINASKVGSQANVDFIIGVGGGSPLDAAKAIAFMLKHPGGEELLYTPGDDEHLPLALIPTTCGTGSEVTPVSVLTLPELGTKKSISHKIFADIALIDGRYLKSAPLQVIRNTALDALTHMIESFLNTKADDFSRMYVSSGLDLWKKNMSVLENGEADTEQLCEMMNASAMAGMAIAQTSTGIPHGLSYSLTIGMHIPHGAAVGYFTAGYINEADEADRRYLLDKIGFSDTDEFQNWYSRLFGIKSVPEQMIDNAVSELWKNQPKIKTARFDVDFEKLKRIALFSCKYR